VPLPGVGDIPIVRPRKDECAPIFRTLIDASKAADQEEHWRLAYVGLTRAAERLVIAGIKPKRDVVQASWHSAAARALQTLGAAPAEIEGWGAGLIWEGQGAAPISRKAGKPLLSPIALPDWIRQPAPVESRPPRPLAPSQIAEDRDAAPPPSPEMREAARRGTLLHSLFERLPGVAPANRQSIALRWLERAGVEAESSRLEIAGAACSIIADPAFVDLFSTDALAEAPIAATLPDGRVVAGTVDRLCVGLELVRVIDFKTGRGVPADRAGVPPAHRAQMEAYSEALRVIFPGRRVEASLLYTSGPRLITLPG